MRYTNFFDEIESNEKDGSLSFEVVLLLATAGFLIGFFAVVATYAAYLGV